jgi:hypothetical protein
MTPVSASTPTQPATSNTTPAPPREASAPRAPARPSRMAQDSFDSALRRAGERSASTDDNASVHDDEDDDTPENLLATAQTVGTRATAVPNTPAGVLAAPASATEAVVAMQIAQPTWSSSSLPPGALGAVPNAWSVQLTDAGLPIQQLNMQRLTAGPQAGLHLSMSTSADSRRLPLDRLRERLATKGQAPQSLSLHAPTQDAAQDAQEPV